VPAEPAPFRQVSGSGEGRGAGRSLRLLPKRPAQAAAPEPLADPQRSRQGFINSPLIGEELKSRSVFNTSQEGFFGGGKSCPAKLLPLKRLQLLTQLNRDNELSDLTLLSILI